MKTRLFTLFALLIGVCSGVWAESVTVTLSGRTTKDAKTVAAVPTIDSSSATITLGACGTTCANSGYFQTNGDGKYIVVGETNYYLTHTYNSGNKVPWKDAGASSQYGTFTIPSGYIYTVKRVQHAMATQGFNENVNIVIRNNSSVSKYSTGNIEKKSVSNESSVDFSTINIAEANWVSLTEGTYTIGAEVNSSNTGTGKYFGIGQIILTGELAEAKVIATEVFDGIKINNSEIASARYSLEGNVITLSEAYVSAPTLKLINLVTYTDESTIRRDISVSFAKNGLNTFFEGTATIGATTYTVKIPVDNEAITSTITWAFNDQGNTLTPIYSANGTKIATSAVTLGSEITYEANSDHCFVDSNGDDDVLVSRVKPNKTTDNTITFTITPKIGVKFTPTSVSFVAMKQVTNGDVTLNADWISEGLSTINLESNIALRRASSSGTYNKPGGDRKTYNLVTKGASTATGTCGLKLTLNTAAKSYGIGEIIITGYIYGEEITITANVGAKGFATYVNNDYALDFTGKSIKAYTIASTDGSALTLTQKNKVSKGEPVLLYSETNSDSQDIPAIAESEATATVGNMLVKGTGAAITWAEGTKYYVLYTGGENPGFFRANNSVIATNKAYLDLTGIASARALSFSLDMDNNETTGIAKIGKASKVTGNTYDLQGRRVVQPTKGLYIVNGKKLVKK